MDAAGNQNAEKPLLDPLTRREQEILGLLAEGLTSGEMAERLTLAVSSVRWYVQQIYGKLGVNGKRQALTRASELGLLQLNPLNLVTSPVPLKDFPSRTNRITPKHNLPIQLTSFIGRHKEIETICELLQQHRLVTLTGSGGVGKTRLSLQVAEELVEQFVDGVWLVELAPVSDPTLVTQIVASVLGLKSAGSQPIHEILLDYLHARQVLLVLDNCEHLIEDCAILVDELLRSCQNLKILVSSREALGVAGEIPFRVPSMTLPDLSHLPELVDMEQFEAVRLFNERARTAVPDFQFVDRNAPFVAKICQRLDGIPLAIELAAARLNVLTTEQLALQLDHAFRLLTGGMRTALPRQQTLRATIDWSFRLLSTWEQALLRRLSVFSGSFDLQAVEAVCCLEDAEKVDALDGLGSLVNKSVLLVEPQPDQDMRYHLLETVRQYAREKLNDAGENQRLHDLHAGYYLDMVKEDGLKRFAGQAPAWYKRVDLDFPNIRAALLWALEGQALDEGIDALLTLWYYWLVRGITEEGRALLEKALNAVDANQPSLARAGLLCNLGFLGLVVGGMNAEDHENLLLSREMFRGLEDRIGYGMATMWLGYFGGIEASYFEESVAIFKEYGDDEGLAFTLFVWGNAARESGDLDRAEIFLKESERLYRKMGLWRLGSVYEDLGYTYFLMGQTQQARSLFNQAMPMLEGIGNQFELIFLKIYMGELELTEAFDDASLRRTEALLLECLEMGINFGNKFWVIFYIYYLLAMTAHKLGAYPRAVERFRESLSLLHSLMSHFYNRVQSFGATYVECLGGIILGLAETAVCLDQAAYSARLLGALEGLRELEKGTWKKLTPENVKRISDLTRDKLVEADFQVAWKEGRRMNFEQAIALALEDPEGH